MKRVAVIGVTGSVGQEFVQSLEGHPWFQLTQIAASERSAGKKYTDALRDAAGIVSWDVGGEVPGYVRDMQVRRVDELDTGSLDLVFSAVESEAARSIETKMAESLPVISTSSAYRYEEDVPILIPGVNDDQADLLDRQRERGWKGWVAPLPNCTTTGLAITLKPLLDKYGVKKVMMTSMQAISGGGKSGVSAMGITDNILPFIPKEEGKVKRETRKILGKLKDGRIEDADIRISCTCTRVPVIDGHTESVFVETEGGREPLVGAPGLRGAQRAGLGGRPPLGARAVLRLPRGPYPPAAPDGAPGGRRHDHHHRAGGARRAVRQRAKVRALFAQQKDGLGQGGRAARRDALQARQDLAFIMPRRGCAPWTSSTRPCLQS